MFSDQHLLPARRLLAAALSVAALGMVSPALAHQADDDDATGDKKEVRVYRMGDDDDDSDQGDRTDKGDRDDRDNKGDRANVYHYKVERADSKGGYLGVQVQDITSSLMKARDLSSDEGALVNRVEDESPASESGMERGDVIVEVNRQAIKDSQDLIQTMKDTKPGSRVEVVVLRDGDRKSLRVEVGKRPHDMMMAGPGFRGGMDPEQMKQMNQRLRDIDPEVRAKMYESRKMMQDPEFRQQLDDLRKEVESLKDEIRDLKQELQDSRENSRGGRSGR
jgi:membrane-associated protease RseP (regulator of RpoE activity)